MDNILPPLPEAVPPLTPKSGDGFKRLVILAVVIAILIIVSAAIYRFGPFKFTQPQLSSTPTPVAISSAVPPKIVCKRFDSLDEALKNTDIACVLDLSNQKLTEVPAQISQLTKLNELSFKNNDLTEVPKEVLNITTIISLDLSNNQISTLPPEISQLINLQLLDLSNNKLTTIPSPIQSLIQLRTLKLTGNDLSLTDKETIKKLLPATKITF